MTSDSTAFFVRDPVIVQEMQGVRQLMDQANRMAQDDPIASEYWQERCKRMAHRLDILERGLR